MNSCPLCLMIYNEEFYYHEYFENDELELYKLDEDIGERINLASTYPEKTRELLDSLLVWRNKNNAPVPKELNPHFKEGLE